MTSVCGQFAGVDHFCKDWRKFSLAQRHLCQNHKCLSHLWKTLTAITAPRTLLYLFCKTCVTWSQTEWLTEFSTEYDSHHVATEVTKRRPDFSLWTNAASECFLGKIHTKLVKVLLHSVDSDCVIDQPNIPWVQDSRITPVI